MGCRGGTEERTWPVGHKGEFRDRQAHPRMLFLPPRKWPGTQREEDGRGISGTRGFQPAAPWAVQLRRGLWTWEGLRAPGFRFRQHQAGSEAANLTALSTKIVHQIPILLARP